MPTKQRSHSCSLTLASANAGGLLGSAVAALLHVVYNEEAILSWAWRIPFLCGVFLAICGIYLQRATHRAGGGDAAMAHLRTQGQSDDCGGESGD